MNHEQTTKLHFEVGPEHNKSRLDDFLFRTMTTLSKMYLRELVRDGLVEVNGLAENIGYKLRTNDFIELKADMTRGTAMQPEDIPIDVVFQDREIIVVNKPAGILVHPTHRDKHGTLLNGLTHYLNKGGDKEFVRPGLIHRLDKETSGLIVIAKTARSHRTLANHFMRKLVEKKYVARIDGVVELDQGVIESSIGRFAELKMWDNKIDGKHALTRFKVRRRLADSTIVELEPVTGRTNQLRIHCASIGHPIVGDTQRGGSEFRRLCLHAERIRFRHPATREFVEFNVAADLL